MSIISSSFKNTELYQNYKFTEQLSRVQQLEKVHEFSTSFIPVLYPPKTVGPFFDKHKHDILKHLSDRLSKTLLVSTSKIEVKNASSLLNLLFEIHIHSAAFLYDRLEYIDIRSVQEAGKQLFQKKNADYGDAFAIYGVIGVLIRMQDKISRYINLKSKASTTDMIKVSTETVTDTLIDLNNYAAMAIMLLYSSAQ